MWRNRFRCALALSGIESTVGDTCLARLFDLKLTWSSRSLKPSNDNTIRLGSGRPVGDARTQNATANIIVVENINDCMRNQLSRRAASYACVLHKGTTSHFLYLKWKFFILKCEQWFSLEVINITFRT
ncbi:hypothetical protein PUN28_006541 [Cardiocondyla obscurior]|uniref:Secreted protein n=1 Tax=Cardiocondyla obscurior TaxID=286306 RepID=A0AAW2GD24_9HYME